jgi:periplasmic divalent cation tolerance protein
VSVLIVHCTCPERATAKQLARSLVEQRLAACVSLLPGVHSIYRWGETISEDEEVLLLIKTSVERLEAVKEHIIGRHPYELPEILAVEARAGLDRYLDWVGSETSPVPK